MESIEKEYYIRPSKKIKLFEKKSKQCVSQMINTLHKSILVNQINNIPEIIHKYLYAKAIEKLKDLK